jgi:hypothetical protein
MVHTVQYAITRKKTRTGKVRVRAGVRAKLRVIIMVRDRVRVRKG